jgi:hypothetical protein
MVRAELLIKKPANQGEFGDPMAVGKEAVVTDAVKSVGQAVEQEAANELMGVERHHLGFVLLAAIAPLEADPGPVHGDEPAVGDCHAVGVAAEIGEHLLGRAERLPMLCLRLTA